MMVDNEDLGLSLSLNFPATTNRTPVQLNRMPSAVSSSYSPHFPPQKTSWNDIFCSIDRTSDSRSFLKGIDVNRPPTATDCNDDAGVSSPNSTISSCGKRCERETINLEDNEIERSSSRGISDEEDGENSRKKLRLSKDQAAVLEESFKEHNTLNPRQKLALAKKLGLRPRQVEVWFQNRRARTKLKQTEVDCEFLKRCCENLTEENRRLQKEVQELRALKTSPQFYMQMAPPTTLTMCPSCERVAPPPSSASGATSSTHHARPLPMILGSTTHNHHPWATSATTISLRQPRS